MLSHSILPQVTKNRPQRQKDVTMALSSQSSFVLVGSVAGAITGPVAALIVTPGVVNVFWACFLGTFVGWAAGSILGRFTRR